MNAKISVAGLTKRYGSVLALDDISFEVEAGQIFGLLGANGAGKTSLLECLVGLRAPDSGSIQLRGPDARVGVALQATALQDRITPREALHLFGSFYHRPIPAGTLLERFSLQEKARAPYESLSGGQKQRLALALAFVNDPEILILDEPTAGLDPEARQELHAAILRCKAEGRTVLLTTHYLEEAQLLCDRLATLRGGRLVTDFT